MRYITAVLLFALSAPALAAEVTGVRLWAGPDGTRVVLDLTGPSEHSLFVLRDPSRLVVDLPGATLGDVAAPTAEGLVKGLRSGARESGVRLVLDLNAAVKPRSFLVPPNEVYGHRLVLDLEPVAPAAAPASLPTPAVAILPSAPPSTSNSSFNNGVRTLPSGEARDIVIAIDAGHGGEDPGARGRKGTREKDITLAIARKLKTMIDMQPGMKGVLIRDGDYFIPLEQRPRIARQKHHADMFISIHADAFKKSTARGSSVFVLSNRGATSTAAKWLADRENAADLVGGVSLSDKDDVVASVLLDLSQTASLAASMEVGSTVLRELDDLGKLHKSQVQAAGFVVLKAPDIPSILVETAFITNPEEEKRLRDPKHQTKVADAILTGVKGYFYSNPPAGTRVAMLVRAGGNGGSR